MYSSTQAKIDMICDADYNRSIEHLECNWVGEIKSYKKAMNSIIRTRYTIEDIENMIKEVEYDF